VLDVLSKRVKELRHLSLSWTSHLCISPMNVIAMLEVRGSQVCL
jgi:hypothetical protein